jgi:type IV pilus assembly protein PilY1
MLLSDGQWNTPGCTIGNSPYTDSSDPVVPAYQMHKGFTNAVSSAASQVSSVYTLGLFLGGTGSQALKNVSMYGSFDTAHGAWPASLTGYPLTTCSMTDCGTGKGSSCTALPATSGDWDKDANSVPDTFYSSSDALGIKDAIYNAILDTLRRVSSGTAVSILTSTQGSGANLLQAVFYPKKVFGTAGSAKEISWISDVQDLWFFYDPLLANLSIREDTDQNKILNLSNDKILEFFYDTTTQAARAHLWSDAGDGTKLNPGSPATVDFDDVNAIWKAGRLLWQRSASDRTIYTSLNGSSFSTFSSANSTSLRPYLQASTNTEAGYVIDYVRGVDRNAAGSPPNYRDRTVSINGAGPYVWKLGDVISSTPAVSATSALNAYHKAAPGGYGDATYEKFVGTSDYLNRGMVFLGANDGMFHAFTMGKLQEKWSGQGAREKGMISLPTGLPTGYSVGDERWAYIPKHALPYLIYLTDDAYSHLFYVDLNPVAADVSITTPTYASSSSTVDCYPATAPTCTSGNYYDCPKQTCTDKSTNAIVSSSWETIVIGGMGTGGASRSTTDACSAANDCVKAPLADPADNTKALGLSSYFAMKVTNQNSPALLWEFSSPDLGYATTGAAIVRVSGKINGTGSLNSATNGRWFAVLASGPTGPITSNQFKGNSINNLKIFILDLKTGSLLRTIDTGKTNAFAGSLFNAATDLDRNDPPRAGNYSDDVLYFGYTQKDTVAGTWTKGGVMRLVTHESTDPATWTFSDVITDTGPVTRAVVKLQDINAGKLWLYFGSGRYYYKIGTTIDDSDTQRALYGVTEPCYVASTNSYDPACTSLRYVGDLTNQTTTISSTASASGWKINLEQSSTSYKAERVVTDPVAASTGAVFFTTYEPSSDVCSLEGNTFLWGVKYDNGGILPASALSGELIIQVSTGAIEQKQLSSSFASGRRSAAITGKPSPSAPSLANNAGLKSTPKYMNLKER